MSIFLSEEKRFLTECLIEDKKVKYDGCSTNDLSYAKEFYKDMKYIGSSHVYFINGVENKSERLHHFFIRN